MNKIELLLFAPLEHNKNARLHPIGQMHLASFLKKHLNENVCIRIIDFSKTTIGLEQFESSILKYNPDIIGFSVYITYVLETADIIRKISKKYPNISIITGGPHVTLESESFIKSIFDVFQLSIIGEAEVSLLELMKLLLEFNRTKFDSNFILENKEKLFNMEFFYNNNIIFTPKRSLAVSSNDWVNPYYKGCSISNYEFYFFDKFDNKKRKAISLVTSRGCPHHCSFCSIIAKSDTGRWRGIDETRIIQWLEYIYQDYKFEHIYFMDANFFTNKNRVLNFSRLLQERFNSITWSTSSSVTFLIKNEKELPFLFRNGLRMIEVGIEAGTQSQLDYFNKSATLLQNIAAINMLQKNNIEIGLDFIMFSPNQNLEDIQGNLKFLATTGLIDLETFDHYRNSLYLFPKTKIRADYETLVNIELDGNVIPDIRNLFYNNDVRKVFLTFVKFFDDNISLINKVISNINLELKYNNNLPKNKKSILRLKLVKIRHIIFKMLWELTKESECKEDIFIKYSNTTKDLYNIHISDRYADKKLAEKVIKEYMY